MLISVENVIRQDGTDKMPALKNGFNRRQQFARSVRLCNIAGSACVQGLFYDLPRAIPTEEKDFRFRRELSDSSSNLNSIECRKTYIKQDKIRLCFLCSEDRVQPVRTLADDPQCRILRKRRSHEPPKRFGIVHDKNAD